MLYKIFIYIPFLVIVEVTNLPPFLLPTKQKDEKLLRNNV